MRILGIDPGTQLVGCGCLELQVRAPRSGGPRPLAQNVDNLVVAGGRAHGAMQVVAVELLRLGPNRAIAQRLTELQRRLEEVLAELEPDEVALEEAFSGRSVQSALRIGEARGVILAVAGRRGIPVFQYTPAKIKRVVTGHGQASKEQVARMVGQLLGLGSLPEPADLTDALAVALCRAEERRSPV